MYSDFFDFDEPSFYELYSTSTGVQKDTIYFRVKVNVQEGIHYMQIFEIARENLTKLIKNSTQFDVDVRSAATKSEPPQVVRVGQTIYYGQCHPKSSGNKLVLSMVSEQHHQISIDVDISEIKSDPQFFETPILNTLIQVNTQFIGANTVLEVKMIRKDSIRGRRDSLNSSIHMFHFGINFISFSIMRLRDHKPRQELLNLVFSKISAGIEVKGGSEFTFVGYVDNFQADNNSLQDTNFPVILRKELKSNEDQMSSEYTRLLQWHIVLENPLKSSHLYFSKVEVKLSSIEAFIEEEYVDTLLNFGKTVIRTLSIEAATDIHECVKRKYYSDLNVVPDQFDLSKRVWEHSELSPNNNSVYIDYILISPMLIILSYFQNASSTVEKDFELVSLMGVVLGGFEEAPIKIKEITGE